MGRLLSVIAGVFVVIEQRGRIEQKGRESLK